MRGKITFSRREGATHDLMRTFVECEQCLIPPFINIHETGAQLFSRLSLVKSSLPCPLLWLDHFAPEKSVHLTIEAEKSILFQEFKL